MNAIGLIAEGSLMQAKAIIFRALDMIREKKISIIKQVIGEATFGPYIPLNEANLMKQGRVLLIRRRIRKGKLQRMVRKSAVKGYTLRHGKITRIPVARRIHMRIVQRRAARKRKAHMQHTLRKRKLSLRKRKSFGIHE